MKRLFMIWLEIAIIVLLIVINGLLSMSELAVVSARKSRLQREAEQGNHAAKTVLSLLEKPGNFLATVQVGITLVSIIAGVYGGAALSHHLADRLAHVPGLNAYASSISLFVVVLIITYLSLVIGELLPKRLALSHPEAIAKVAAPPLLFISTLCKPIVWLLDRSTDLFVMIFGIRERTTPDISQEDITSMVDEGTRTGIIDPEEQEIIQRLFELSDRTLSAIMTPRKEIVPIKKSLSILDAWELVMSEPHHFFPVFEDFKEEPIGVISAKELAAFQLKGYGGNWESIIQPPLIVPVTASPLTVLDQFKQKKAAMALVVDEFGSFIGIVTLHDIIEALVGDIDDIDEDPAGIVTREDGSLLMDASLSVEVALDHLQLTDAISEEKGQYHSLGGFVFKRLGHLPKVGEHFTWKNWRFEVIDMDRTRIDKVLITAVAELPDAPVAPAAD
jgi:putative hemolysin